MRLRLFRDVFVIEAKRQMSYRADFWIATIGGLVAGIALPYFMWRAIYDAQGSPTVSFGGYTFPEMVTYYVAIAFAAKVVRGADLLTDASADIYEGRLTRYLLYPAGYLPFKYAQHLGLIMPYLVQLSICGVVCAVVIDIPDSVDVSWTSCAMAAVSAALANLLYFLLAYPVQLIAFWADNVWSLLVLMRLVGTLLGGFLLPLSLFPDVVAGLLRYTPFPCFYSAPVEAFMGRLSLEEWYLSLLTGAIWCVVLVAFSRVLWRRGTLKYTGVGI